MASSRRAARASRHVPEQPSAETVTRRRRTAHDSLGFQGIITWENGVPVRVWNMHGAAIEGPKAQEFVHALSLPPIRQTVTETEPPW